MYNTEEIIKNIVKKYNFGKVDEDMVQDGWVCWLENKQWCDENNIKNENYIQARFIKAFIHDILDAKKKKKLERVPYEIDYIEEMRDLGFLLVDIRNSLNESQLKIFELLLQGKNYKEICNELKISQSKYSRICKSIKNKIQS